ncbi:MAG: hypothetical protein QOI20_1839, partial [Acidimicrobiaceae bacterium]|nr:hypothetical protein [Acidimicrobiaceae bacterium]
MTVAVVDLSELERGLAVVESLRSGGWTVTDDPLGLLAA